MFFRAFAPDLADDAEELRRAVSGQATWVKAADAERVYLVSARTLSQKTALGGFELGGAPCLFGARRSPAAGRDATC